MGFLRRNKNKKAGGSSVSTGSNVAVKEASKADRDNAAAAARGSTDKSKRKGLGGLFRKKSQVKTPTKQSSIAPSTTTSTAPSTPESAPPPPRNSFSSPSKRHVVAIIPASAGNLTPSSILRPSPRSGKELDEQESSHRPSRIDQILDLTKEKNYVRRNLLGDFDMVGDDGSGGTELVLPSSTVSIDYDSETDHPDDEVADGAVITVREKQPDEEDLTDRQRGNTSVVESMLSALQNKAERHDDEGGAVETVLAVEDDAGSAEKPVETKVPETSDSTTPKVSSADVPGTGTTTKSISDTILNALSCTTEEAEHWSSTVPAALTTCGPIIERVNKARAGMSGRSSHEYFNDQFAVKFLHGLLNVGYTLVYHQAVDDDDWVGRTVNLLFKPGVCTSKKIEQPSIEWATMGGGKTTAVETKSISLLCVDAISVPNIRGGENPFDVRDDDRGTNIIEQSHSWCSMNPFVYEELDCFFTITADDGEIHLFESINTEECKRIVAGIRNITSRFCSQLIAGDSNVVADFFDNSHEPEETQLSTDEAMLKVSNCFLDTFLL